MSTHLTEKTESKFPEAALARQTLLFDDARTRITQWRFAPGDQSGWHRHEWDYVTVQQSGGRLRLESRDGRESFVDYLERFQRDRKQFDGNKSVFRVGAVRRAMPLHRASAGAPPGSRFAPPEAGCS